MRLNHLTLWLAWAAGNFIYQFAQSEPDWGTAVERSFFQGAIVMACWLQLRPKSNSVSEKPVPNSARLIVPAEETPAGVRPKKMPWEVE